MVKPAETFQIDDSTEERKKKVIQTSTAAKRIIKLWRKAASIRIR